MVEFQSIGNHQIMDVSENDIQLGEWEITDDWLNDYLIAVCDTGVEYRQFRMVPPVAISSLIIGALLEKLGLPSGTIHSLQEIETLGPALIGDLLRARAVIGQPRQRGGVKFVTVNYRVNNAAGEEVQVGRSTVLVPTEAAIE